MQQHQVGAETGRVGGVDQLDAAMESQGVKEPVVVGDMGSLVVQEMQNF